MHTITNILDLGGIRETFAGPSVTCGTTSPHSAPSLYNVAMHRKNSQEEILE